MLKSFRNKINLHEEDQKSIEQQISANIDALVDNWASNLKSEIISGSEQYSAGRSIWDRFKNFVADIYHGYSNKNNPYYQKNTLGYVGTPANEFMTLNNLKGLFQLCEEVEENISKSPARGSKLLIVKMIDVYADKLKDYLKGIFSPLLAAVNVHSHKEDKPPLEMEPEPDTITPEETPPMDEPVEKSSKSGEKKSGEKVQSEKRKSMTKVSDSDEAAAETERKEKPTPAKRVAEKKTEFDDIDIIYHLLNHIDDDKEIIKDFRFIKSKIDFMKKIYEEKPKYTTSETYKTKSDRVNFIKRYYFDLAKDIFKLLEKYNLAIKEVEKNPIKKLLNDLMWSNYIQKNNFVEKNKELEKYDSLREFQLKGDIDNLPVIPELYEIGRNNITVRLFELVSIRLLIDVVNKKLNDDQKDTYLQKINSAVDLNQIRDLAGEIINKVHSDLEMMESFTSLKTKSVVLEFHNRCRGI